MALVLSKPDDTTLTGVTFTIERGIASAHQAVKIKNTGGSPVAGAFLAMYAESSPGSGNYVTEGQPAVDEQMGRFEITGQDSTATPGQQILLGQVQSLGHLAVGLLPPVLAGDWLLADIWLEQGTSSASGADFNVKFEIAGDQKAIPIADGISAFAHGVLTGINQPESFIVSGRATTATGTPDAVVHTATGSWLLAGVDYTDGSTRDSTLNQNDGAAAALTAGQKYIAVLTQSAANAPTVTKGLKGTTPARPTPPTGEIILAWVTVNYGASGSVIATADIDADLTYGRLLVTAPATGLTAVVHAGKSIGEGYEQIHALKENVTLTASATNRVWMKADGNVVKTLSDTPPSPGANWLANAVTSGTAVTSLIDKRTFISTTGVTLTAHASTHATAGTDPVSPASIGASATGHTHVESEVTSLVTDLAEIEADLVELTDLIVHTTGGTAFSASSARRQVFFTAPASDTNNITITLPAVSGSDGLPIRIIHDTTTAHIATIATTGGDIIKQFAFLGAPAQIITPVLSIEGAFLDMVPDGVDTWWVGIAAPALPVVEFGLATLIGGTVTVTNADVKAGSAIVATHHTVGGTPGHLTIPTRTAGTSFVITSTSGTDTSTVDWIMLVV